MTFTEAIRARLRAGEDAASVAIAMDARLQYVRQVAWSLRNPDYKKLKARFWRARNPNADANSRKRRRMIKLMKAERSHQTRKAERVMEAVG